jgi:hypothetical protein
MLPAFEWKEPLHNCQHCRSDRTPGRYARFQPRRRISSTTHNPSSSPPRILEFYPHFSATPRAVEETPQAEVALMLLREICRMIRGHTSEALECRPPPTSFLLDVLGDLLREEVTLFRERASFLEALREDVCGVLLHVLKGQLEADTEQVRVRAFSSQPPPACISSNILPRRHRLLSSRHYVN